MKFLLAFVLCAAPAFLPGAADFRPKAISPRSISIGKKILFRLSPGSFEIVCRNNKNSVYQAPILSVRPELQQLPLAPFLDAECK